MAKQSGALVAIAGAFALLAMGKKKKRRSAPAADGVVEQGRSPIRMPGEGYVEMDWKIVRESGRYSVELYHVPEPDDDIPGSWVRVEFPGSVDSMDYSSHSEAKSLLNKLISGDLGYDYDYAAARQE